MKKIFIIIFLGVFMAIGINFVFHTQSFTRVYGGDTVIELPQGQKLVPYTVQWENHSDDLWYLTEPMEDGYEPKEYKFHESSNLGVWQSTITFKEVTK